MAEHHQRVEDELKELETKRGNLGKFIGGNAIFKTLPADEQIRLQKQFKIMTDYEAILTERIAAFKK